MERHADILRRDAKAPLCLKPLPRWRYEHAFRRTLSEFLPVESDLLVRAVDFLAAHHALAQEFVGAVDRAIVAEKPTASQFRGTLVGLLGTAQALLALKGCEPVVEEVREALADRFQTDGGALPEFSWEKGAADLLGGELRKAGVAITKACEGLFVHLDDIYDDCARTLQRGFWIMEAPWRAEVVDAWLFESAYAFFRHTIPHHLEGPGGMVAIIPSIVGGLQG
jgi:hypothetical protein